MDEALYGADGFYRNEGAAGRRGHFLTSPEVGPLFGAVVANFLDAEWDRLGRPDPFTVVDAGAGPGTLARSVAAAEPRCAAALRYIAVELSDRQRSLHPEHVDSRVDLPTTPFEGVVMANELLDNLPFRLAVFDSGWREAHVVEESEGRLVEQLGPLLEPMPPVLPERASLGARAPLVDRATAWVADARARLTSGTVLVLDYCVPTTEELADRPWRDWLRTYRGHERGGHYLAAPGRQDITTDVPIDQLPKPDVVADQASWLRSHGIDELVEEGRRRWGEGAALGDLEAVRMRSRVSEAEALTDPDGLGGFRVIEWRVG
jgi:SAM-dependent MidA family methyltransferase